MTTGLVIRENGRLTVRLPDDAVLSEGVVDVRTEGRDIVLTPSRKSYGMHLLELMEQIGDDIELPDGPPQQQREGL